MSGAWAGPTTVPPWHQANARRIRLASNPCRRCNGCNVCRRLRAVAVVGGGHRESSRCPPLLPGGHTPLIPHQLFKKPPKSHSSHTQCCPYTSYTSYTSYYSVAHTHHTHHTTVLPTHIIHIIHIILQCRSVCSAPQRFSSYHPIVKG